jgi:imidazolonepropionase-like amidohydrolase
MKVRHMSLIPTLTLFDVEGQKFGEPQAETRAYIDTAVMELHDFAHAEGEILFGTDAGYITQYDTSEEFELMSRAGMSFRDILASLTVTPARRFGRADRSGRIARGMDADLVVLDGDPAKEINAFAKVRYTIRSGRVIYQTR